MYVSLWPQKRCPGFVRAATSLSVRAAVASGVIEFNLFGYFEFLQFRKHFLALADHFASGNETTQTAALLVVAASEFFYPLSLVFILLILEGFLRALAGAILGEVVPSLPIALFVRLRSFVHRPATNVIVR